ncbi:MAG: nucleoside-diphosphate kinase [Armatimonadota bacterium]|nr:nucleoside-diphosphate kinase [Armatimonadota bacterium]
MERTFIMIKPDAVRRRLIGEIISRIEKRNLDIVAMKMLTPSRELAEKHYSVHRGKDFFEPTVEFLCSGPVVAMVVEGENSIAIMRRMIGSVDPLESAPGTIRGDFTISSRENLIHGSDSPESASYEISLWFPELTNN